MVIEGDGETSDEAHVNLSGPVNGGFFLWDMRYDEANNQHELFTVNTDPRQPGDPVLGAGAYEFAAGFAATQDIWHQTHRHGAATPGGSALAAGKCRRDPGRRLCRAGRADAHRP